MAPHLTKAARLVIDKMGLDVGSTRSYLALKRSELAVDSKLSATAGRVAIVGCGAQGTTIALSTKLLSDWSVTDFVDVSPDRARQLNERLRSDARIHDSVDDLLKHRDTFDILVVATTAPTHCGVARRAIEGGVRSVLIEKPVATSLADACGLMEVAADHGCLVAVDHTRRYMPAVPGLRRLLAAGTLGEPRAAYFFMGRAGFAMMGSHIFDFARWLFASDIVRVRAELDPDLDPHHHGDEYQDQVGRAEARLANGVRLVLDLSADLSLRQSTMVVLCQDGRLEVDERLGQVRLIGAGRRVWESEYLHKGTLLDGIARALLELHEGSVPRCGLDDGRAALEAVIACHVSHRSGGAWVDLPLQGAVRNEHFPFA